MGQIARRHKQKQLLLVTRLKQTLARHVVAYLPRHKDETLPTRHQARFSAVLQQVWQLPASLSWMDPLPLAHRRGIILLAVVMLLAFLWPSPVRQPQPVTALQSGAQNTPAVLQADLVGGNVAAQHNSEPEGQWTTYTIAAGQTLAQLFRDNNLPVNDLFAMTQVSGSDALNTLQAGQQVKIRLNGQGAVSGLNLATDSGDVLLTRQADGTFIRTR